MQNKLRLIAFAFAIVAAGKRAPATTFYDSLDTTNGGRNVANSTQWLAGKFTTDNATYSSLTATLSLGAQSLGSAQLDLYNDGGAAPGALVATFTSPRSYLFNLLNESHFTLAGVSLAPNSNYWIVLHSATGSFIWGWTADLSAPWAQSSNGGSMWTPLNLHPPQYRVESGLTILGDYNGNGIADAADYTVWRDTLGSTTDLRANGNNAGMSAGVIDQDDYVYWQQNFGRVGGSGSESASADAVPEPSTAMLLLAALAIGVSRVPAIRRYADIITSVA
jgi:hypothetical protein